MSVKIKCESCGKSQEFGAYRLLEKAILVCPNCSAEFSLTANLSRLPGGGEQGGEEPSEPSAPGDYLDDLDFGFPGDEEGDGGGEGEGGGGELDDLFGDEDEDDEDEDDDDDEEEEPEESRRTKANVLCCSRCRRSWLATVTESKDCPKCGKQDKVSEAKVGLTERVSLAIQAVENGLPVKQVVGRLIGRK